MKNTNIPSEWLIPIWDAPKNIKAIMTTRQGGVSFAPFDSMNLGDHVEDDLQCVTKNRVSLKQRLNLPNDPLWLTQVHGLAIANADQKYKGKVEADASVAHQVGSVCAVMTADCLPVLFCNRQGTAVAAAHAGWRGLQAGILEQTVTSLNCPVEEVMAWFGVAIGAEYFEVGGEVREAFVSVQAEAEKAFVPSENVGKYLADIYLLARLRLQAIGVSKITGGEYCSYKDKERFYSYRREAKTGRMVSLIWMGE
ncbi:MAG: peptidoglycan editing factor PgeF [Cocleimonas sp.]|nr:peptidoglycan editing factor PgeF [Cocleimonas sp.]